MIIIIRIGIIVMTMIIKHNNNDNHKRIMPILMSKLPRFCDCCGQETLGNRLLGNLGRSCLVYGVVMTKRNDNNDIVQL